MHYVTWLGLWLKVKCLYREEFIVVGGTDPEGRRPGALLLAYYDPDGRLVRFLDGHVRIVKDNGHTSTVPLARLSRGDLEFVNRQASAQQSELGKTAQTPAVMPTRCLPAIHSGRRSAALSTR